MSTPTEVVVTNDMVLEALGPVAEICEREFTVSISHRLGLSRRSISDEAKALEKTRQSLVDRHAETYEDGTRVLIEGTERVKIADQRAFDQEWQELLEQETTVKVYPVTIAELEKFHADKATRERKGKGKKGEDAGPAEPFTIKPRVLGPLVELGIIELEDDDDSE